MSKAAVVSLKYHPGHFSHLIANYQLLKDCGINPVLFVNKKFNNLDTSFNYNIKNKIAINEYSQYDFVFFWFPSHLNLFEIFKFRFFGKAKIIYIFHEPIDNYQDFYKSGHNIFKILKLFFINTINKIIVKFSSHIILPSKKAYTTYQNNYTFLNNKFQMIPLLFDDENILTTSDIKKRRYISYIGTIASDHAFENFFNFLEASIINNYFNDFIFLIATGSKISNNFKIRINKFHSTAKLKIIEGAWLTNNEINNFYKESILVWNAYERSSQSGVLPKAFMFSTPVLGYWKTSNEFLIDRINGIYLNNNTDILEIRDAINDIINNFDVYSYNSRTTFLNKYFYKNYLIHFKTILNNE